MNNSNKLPNFFILGAAKAGTTSLYEYLKNHPEIFLSPIKEPQFFSNENLYDKGLNHYLETYFKKSEGFLARGEATPHYLYYEKVARRLSEVLPEKNQKFIVILRDPVKRAHSLYWNMVAEGIEKLSFKDALAMESKRFDSISAELEKKGAIQFQYVDSGLYAKQLKQYFRYFDKDNFLILFFEDFVNDRENSLRIICQFLQLEFKEEYFQIEETFNKSGMPRFQFIQNFMRQPNMIKKNLGLLLPYELKYKIVSKILEINKKDTSYSHLEEHIVASLRRKFEEDVLELQEITGRSLTQWLPQ